MLVILIGSSLTSDRVACFFEAPHFRESPKGEVRRIILLRGWVHRRRRALPEIAELAALEPAQCLLEGVWADAHIALEREVEGGHGE